MKLYDMNKAPNARRVRIFLAEKALQIPLVEIDIPSGENLREPFTKVNPRGLLPVLELDDGRTITESMAICRYIEVLYPEPNLFGRDAFEQAQIEQWQRSTEFDGFFNVGMAFRNSLPTYAERASAGVGPKTLQIPELAERGLMQARNWMQALDKRMRGREYLATDRFSVADITAFVSLEFAKWVGLRPSEEQADLSAYYNRLKARPSATA